jgi:Tol biopolymer transport system component
VPIVGRSAGVALAAALIAIPAAGAAPGDLIVFTRGERLFAINSDGSGLRRLSRTFEGAPAVSADGRLVASVGAGGIVVRTRAGRRLRRIGLRSGSEVTQLSWSPGGRWIAFLAERCESGGRDVGPLCADLRLVSRNGRGRRRLVDADVATSDLVNAYSWSPDGRSIVFERYERGGLAIVDVRTAKTHGLPGTRRFGSRDLDWSPRGWIAFARQRGPFRGSDLYLVRPNGRGLKKVCRAENAKWPVFSRDGRQLAFLDYRPTGGSNRWLVRVLRLGGRCRTVGTATEEWTLRWSPDGDRLLWENFVARLMIGRADGAGRPRFLTRGSTADWGQSGA